MQTSYIIYIWNKFTNGIGANKYYVTYYDIKIALDLLKLKTDRP